MNNEKCNKLLELVVNIFNCADSSGRGSAIQYFYEVDRMINEEKAANEGGN